MAFDFDHHESVACDQEIRSLVAGQRHDGGGAAAQVRLVVMAGAVGRLVVIVGVAMLVGTVVAARLDEARVILVVGGRLGVIAPERRPRREHERQGNEEAGSDLHGTDVTARRPENQGPPFAGKRILNVVPDPGRLSKVSDPPWDSTIHFAIARPSPAPPGFLDLALSAR